MPKHKMKRKSTTIDMTAMCDVSFLLLTFFMLATKFKPPENFTVVTPTSISDTKIAETNVMVITIDKDGRVFFEMDGQPTKKELITAINDDRKLGLNENEMNSFALGGAVGVPFDQLKNYLNTPLGDQKEYKSPGIPVDTALTDANELFKWVAYGRIVNPEARLVIKGDVSTKYPMINKVFSTLANDKIKGYKFNLVTSMKMGDQPKEDN